MTVPRIAMTAPTGPTDAPLLLLGPSLGTSTILWDAATTHLRERYRVAAWDLPGHGRAPAATAPFTVAELSRAVLDAAPEPRFFFAGVSLGGAVGLEVLLAAPERVAAAAIICSGATISTPASWLERATTVRSQGTASLIVASAARWFAPGSIERNPDITGRLLHSLRDADDESYARCCEALATYDAHDRLGEIDTTTLALWAEFDQVTPEASAAEIATGVRRGRVSEITDASHLAVAEQPAAVASTLIDFFEGAP